MVDYHPRLKGGSRAASSCIRSSDGLAGQNPYGTRDSSYSQKLLGNLASW